MMRGQLAEASVLLAALLVACGSSTVAATSGDGGPHGDAGALSPCDPLTPPPVALGTILGVGQDAQSTLYVADLAGGSIGRVFVSSGSTLYRKHIAGSGQSGVGADADYDFTFQDPGADAATAQALLVQVRGGVTTAMALAPGSSRGFIGDAGAGDQPLTVVSASAVSGLALQNLPGAFEYVADLAGGDAVVVTAPMDYGSSADFRLFYGPPGQMVERSISGFDQSRSGGPNISFAVDSSTLTVHFTIVYPADGGPFGTPGPVTLDTGDGGTVSGTQRVPTPASLVGFSFVCLGP